MIERNEEAPEIQTQGLWGKRSRKEIIIAASVVCTTVVALVVVIAVLATGGDDSEPASSQVYERPTEVQRLIASEQEELNLLIGALGEYPSTKSFLANIPSSIGDLEGKHTDASASPETRAAAWLIHQDPLNDEAQLQRRFALAYIYYNNGGENWNRNTDWLSEKSHCEWEGVNCAGNPRNLAHVQAARMPENAVYDLNFNENNLTGGIPASLILLRGLQSLFFQSNKLAGPLDTSAIASLPNLLKVYLQHNLLTGEIPASIVGNGVIDTFFLQGNRLTGQWPQKGCPSCVSCDDGILKYFGMDCLEVTCPFGCCNQLNNCYYPKDTQEDL